MAIDLDDGDELAEPDDKKKRGSRSSDKGEEKKPRGRPSNDARSSERQATIKEELEELAAWLSDPELAKAVKEGAPRISKFLAAYAKRHNGIARLVDVVFSPTGPLAGLRAFGPTARRVGDLVGAWRERRVDEAEQTAVDSDGFLVDAHTGLRVLAENGQPIFVGTGGES